MRKGLWIVVGLCVAASSCARSIYRTTNLPDKTSSAISVDAKQRFMTTTYVDPTKRDGTGRLTELRKICMEPSPDVFSVLAASMEGSVKYKDKASADFKAALSEAASTIGIRTETIQLLRDAMYRVCELGMNDELKPEDALDLHRHYQKSMVTLAAVSALADSTRPVQVAIASNATITNGALQAQLAKKIDEQKAEVDKLAKPKDEAEAKLAEARTTACDATVKDDSEKSCADDPAKCALGDGKTKLCDEKIKNATAKTDKEQTDRVTAACGSDTNKDAEVCKKFAEASAAAEEPRTSYDNAKGALDTLEAELDAAKKNSDLGATTTVTSIAPSTVQPSKENVHEVACVVRQLVTQVYASDFVDICLDVVKRHNAKLAEADMAQKRAELMTSYAAKFVPGGGAPGSGVRLMTAPSGADTWKVQTTTDAVKLLAQDFPAIPKEEILSQITDPSDPAKLVDPATAKSKLQSYFTTNAKTSDAAALKARTEAEQSAKDFDICERVSQPFGANDEYCSIKSAKSVPPAK